MSIIRQEFCHLSEFAPKFPYSVSSSSSAISSAVTGLTHKCGLFFTLQYIVLLLRGLCGESKLWERCLFDQLSDSELLYYTACPTFQLNPISFHLKTPGSNSLQ